MSPRSAEVEKDDTPKIVVGFVKSCKKHPDSDHLSITQTEVEQIIPKLSSPRKTPGQIIKPSGIIAPGLATTTFCPALMFGAPQTILRLPNAPAKKGILELPFDAEVGSAFAVGE
jgi:tRNA-binding protein